jgi:CRISPR-associated exonuclease Cas4
MTIITATHISYFHTCRRKLWLFHHAIRMEHTSDVVYEGKLIGETTYGERAEKNKQLELSIPIAGGWTGAAKIDFYDAKNRVVHETKKSDKMEQAHVAQVKFYLYVLQRSGVEGARGIIEYPKQRERTELSLAPGEEAEVERWLAGIREIIESERCPAVIRKPVCKQCSYFEFCYADEL